MLIYSGFDPQKPDNFGSSPLHLACISGNLSAVKLLCAKVRQILDFVPGMEGTLDCKLHWYPKFYKLVILLFSLKTLATYFQLWLDGWLYVYLSIIMSELDWREIAKNYFFQTMP